MQKICGMKGKNHSFILPALIFLIGFFLPPVLVQADIPDTTFYFSDSLLYELIDTTVSSTQPAEWMGPHELPSGGNIEPQQRNTDFSVNYITAILIVIVLLVSLVKFLFPLRFKEVIMAVWESRFYNLIEREGGLFNNWVTFFLFLNFLFSLSFLLYQSLLQKGYTEFIPVNHPAVVLLYALGFIVGYYLIKFLIMIFAGWIFKTSRPTESVLRITLIVYQFAGIVIFPLLVINFYNPTPWLLTTAWVILLLLVLYRLIRISFIGLGMGGFSAYHLILYLCTIEIAPLLFIIKYTDNILTG